MLLSVQRALVGATSPALYGVCADLSDEARITLTFYVAPDTTPDERDDLSVVGTEVIADFADDFTLEEHILVVADISQRLGTVGFWVYLQRGFRTDA
ncbi:hypothetical protein DSM112329_02868 [Paraconexibacter sp. AEG42_29]|uniref:Uncharacterized protein n=2 Tax=Paraconexibacter sp. AEG42_29 TaxID=2997339 RepID=A0AAU7AWL3_9ACTN